MSAPAIADRVESLAGRHRRTAEPAGFVERPGGRRLAFAELGDPAGLPLIYCHGFPSSRREALLLHPAAAALGLRILAPDRPGYGASDHQPGRTIADWPADVAALADHLDIERFLLIGVSGGGPYALACAWRIPERIAACALVCPLGPLYEPPLLGAMAWPSRLSLNLARRVPALAQLAYGGLTAAALARWPQSVDRLRAFAAPATDRTELARPEIRAILNATIQDAMHRSARGARRDLILYTHVWGIPWERIRIPIDLWHGEADGTVPVAHARWYAHRLPDCRAHLLPREGHYSLPLRHADAILATLRAAADPVDASGR